jgi:hypothetical protein
LCLASRRRGCAQDVVPNHQLVHWQSPNAPKKEKPESAVIANSGYINQNLVAGVGFEPEAAD